MRRRDGLTLAATGSIPARVRAQILAEHRAELSARARTAVRARVDAGLLALPIPYGYRRLGTYRATRATWSPDLPPTLADPPPSLEALVIDHGRTGRARPVHWHLDPDCAATIRFMSWCIRMGATSTGLAASLNTHQNRPRLLTAAGHPRRWTASAVRALLTDPVLTGHSVWGRTRHGRPVPREQWIISAAVTHPPILDPATSAVTSELLATPAITTEPLPAPIAVSCLGRGIRGLRARR